MAAIPSVTPAELKKELAEGKEVFLLDVREPSEFKTVALPGAYLIPLGEIGYRHEDLDPDLDIVVYCHHGMRSAQAIGVLKQKGFTKLRNLAGGIDYWAETVEPGMKRY
ncbi:MAG: hypothetical protein KC466_06255 [Myxococcales bacterium]|nr:hypothetical protein [Myxococcales bacterium]